MVTEEKDTDVQLGEPEEEDSLECALDNASTSTTETKKKKKKKKPKKSKIL